MNLYETVFIARQDLSTSQVEALAAAFGSIIAEQGGQLGKTEYCGLRHLAYPIKKNRKAHYVLMNITAPPAAVSEMERNMRINEDVMRYLSVRVEEHQEGPSILTQQSRSPRDSYRGGHGDYGSDTERSEREYLVDEEDTDLDVNS